MISAHSILPKRHVCGSTFTHVFVPLAIVMLLLFLFCAVLMVVVHTCVGFGVVISYSCCFG